MQRGHKPAHWETGAHEGIKGYVFLGEGEHCGLWGHRGPLEETEKSIMHTRPALPSHQPCLRWCWGPVKPGFVLSFKVPWESAMPMTVLRRPYTRWPCFMGPLPTALPTSSASQLPVRGWTCQLPPLSAQHLLRLAASSADQQLPMIHFTGVWRTVPGCG